MNYITEFVAENSRILWQENEEYGIRKPIVVEPYSDSIQISQGENTVVIQYTAVKDLIKILKDLKEPE